MTRPAADRALLVNTASLVGARYIVAALGWVGTLVIVRTLSLEEWGRFSFVFSLLGLLSVLADLGLGRVALKGLLDDQGDQAGFAGTLVVLRAILGVACYMLAVGFVILARYPPEVVGATAVAGLVLVLASPSHAVESVFQSHLRVGSVAVGNVLGQLSQLALVVAIASAGGSVVLLTIPAVVCEVVILTWRVRRVRRLQTLRLNVQWATWGRLLREAAPLGAGVILSTAYFRVDSVMLSKLDTFSAVGIYGVAYKFVDIAHYLPTALMVTVLSLMVRAWPSDPTAYGDAFRRAFAVLAVVSTIVAVEFAVFARPIVSLLYGEKYEVGAHAARLVVAAECLGAFGVLAVGALVAIGRHKLYPLVALAGLVVNVSLNLWLIPWQSYEGAAMATVATEVLVVGILLGLVSRIEALRPWPLRTLVIAVAGGALAALVAAGAWRFTPWPLAAAAAGAGYVAFLHLFGVGGRTTSRRPA